MKKKWAIFFIFLIFLLPVFTSCFFQKDEEPERNTKVQIYFGESNYKIEVNSSLKLEILFRNIYDTETEVTWESSDEYVATVYDGVVYMHSIGYATITATSITGDMAYCGVTGIINPTSFSIEEENVIIYSGKSMDLNISMEPYNCTENNIEWTSSNYEIASASNNTIFANWDNEGTAVLTATTSNGLTDTVVVTVKQYVFLQSISIFEEGNTTPIEKKSICIPYDRDNISLQLSAELYPKDTSNKEIVWISSNEQIATVDQNGLVNIFNEGSVDIIVEGAESRSSRCKLTVTKEIIANMISFNNSSINFTEGDLGQRLSINWTPLNTTYKEVTWSSSRPNIASVDSNGLVTPLSVGTTVISATTKTGVVAYCNVFVKERIYAESVSLSNNSIELMETKTEQLNATILPSDTTDKTITWQSLDTNIATVDSNGVVKGIYPGVTEITATTTNGISTTCVVTVTELIVNVSFYVDGVVNNVLTTSRSNGYLIDIPEKPDDVTTDITIESYFHGWFLDNTYLTYLTKDHKFESDTNVYGRNVSFSSFNSSYDSNTSDKVISKINTDSDQDIAVVSRRMNGETYYGITSSAVSNSNITTLVLVGLVDIAESAIVNCPNLRRIIIYDYYCSVNTKNVISLDIVSNCPNLILNELNGINYFGDYDNLYKVAVSVSDNTITEYVIPDECIYVGNIIYSLTSLQSVIATENNVNYSSLSGILYNKNLNDIIYVPKYISGDIVLSDTLSSIDSELFKDNQYITSVDIGSNTTIINSYAFYNCKNLVNIYGAESVWNLGDYCFGECVSLTNVNFPKVSTIKNGVFYNCQKLSEYNFYNKISSIGASAFYGCIGLTTMNIPSSVEKLGSSLFGKCYNLQSITLPFVGLYLDETSTKYPFGEIFGTVSYSNSIAVSQYYKLESVLAIQRLTYYIPSGLKNITILGGTINKGSFYNMTNIDELHILDSQVIEEEAFGYSSIKDLYLPGTITTINKDSFLMCNIDNIYFQGHLEDWIDVTISDFESLPALATNNFYINDVLFTDIKDVDYSNKDIVKQYSLYGFTGLETVTFGNSITSIGTYAFYNCQSLLEIELPSTVLSIEAYAFYNCESLTQVELSTNLKSIYKYAFYNCKKLDDVILPDSVVEISSSIFEGCTSLTTVQLSSQITTIPSKAFYNCHSLLGVDITNIDVIETNAFGNCQSIESIEITNEEMVLQTGVFAGCSNLSSLILPKLGIDDGDDEELTLVYYFGKDALDGFSKAYDGYYVPNSLKYVKVSGGTINRNAFNGCSKIENIELFNIEAINYGAFFGCTNLKNLYIDNDIPDLASYTRIFSYTSYDNDGLEITFGKDVTKVPAYFAASDANIAKVIFDEGSICTTIGDYAFKDSSIRNICLPAGLEVIGTRAFYNCGKLLNIDVDSNNTVYSSYEGSLYNKENNKLILYACGNLNTSFEIKSNVSSISDYAFCGAGNLEQIIFNSDLFANGYGRGNAFTGIVNPVDILIGNNVTEIPDYMFTSASSFNIKSINFVEDSVCTTIGVSAFNNDCEIETLNLSKCVTTIRSSAFDSCKIENYNYLGTLEEYLKIHFSSTTANPMYCSNTVKINNSILTDVVIPQSITEIPFSAFYGCKSITSITLHNNVTSIDSNAFAYCINIKEFVLTPGLEEIGYYIFNGCSNLEKLTIHTLETVSASNFKFANLFGKEEFDGSYEVLQQNSKDTSTTFYLPSSLTHVILETGVVTVGAFERCSKITNIVLGDEIEVIEDYAFNVCTNLEQFSLENIRVLGKSAFGNCDKFENIVISNEVEVIGENCFRDCDGLISVEIGNDSNSQTTIIGTGAFMYCQNLEIIKFYNVETISSYAFYECYKLRDLELPDTLTSIGTRSFGYCFGLYSIIIGSNIETISDDAFESCHRLLEVYNMSENVKCVINGLNNTDGGLSDYALVVHDSLEEQSIIEKDGDYFFARYNDKLYLFSYEGNDVDLDLPINKGEYKINSYTFFNRNALNTINIPSNVSVVDSKAFYRCGELNKITSTGSVKYNTDYVSICNNFNQFNYLGTLDDWLTYNFATEESNPMYCANEFRLNGEKVLSYTLSQNILNIGDYAFYKFTDLEEIVVHSNVKTIGRNAFALCENLLSCDLLNTDITTIGEEAFIECKSLVSVTLPTNVKVISYRLFKGCSSLIDIILPDNLTTIESNVFENCIALKEVDISGTVTNMGDDIFIACESLESIKIPYISISLTDKNVLGRLFGKTYQGVKFKYVQQVTSDGSTNGYYIPSSLEEVVVKEGVLNSEAFMNCDWIDLISFENVSYIAENVFNDAASYVTLENGVYYVGSYAISAILSNSFSNVVLRDGTIGVAERAFYNNEYITAITTSSQLKYINKYSFTGCKYLKSVVTNDQLIEIGEYAFNKCRGIKTINIPKTVINIGEYAFQNCTTLYEINVDTNNQVYASYNGDLYSKDMTTLITYAIGKSDTSFTLLDSVVTISKSAFEESILQTITFNSELRNIKERAFYGCTHLTSASLPYWVQAISSYAFYGCSRLERVVIQYNVRLIGIFAFASCPKLLNIDLQHKNWRVVKGDVEIYINENEDLNTAANICYSLTSTYISYIWYYNE